MADEAPALISASWLDWPAALRLHHWTKGLVVLVGLLPTGGFRDPHAVTVAVVAAVLFQLAAAGGYLVNDLLDLRRDRLHPRKRHRPIASGRIAPLRAAAVAVVLTTGAVAAAWWLAPQFGLILMGYVALTLMYSLWLKHAVGADVLTISGLFVLRTVAGVAAIGATISGWYLGSVGALALLLALGKRRTEAAVLSETARVHRITLRSYRDPTWRLVLWAAGILTVACYVIAAGLSPTGRTHPLVLATAVPVALGVWRYLQILRAAGGGEPERLLLKDAWLAGCVALWGASLGIAVLITRV